MAPANLLLAARGLRALADGFVSLLLPAHLLALGYGPVEVGAIATTTMLGSATLNLSLGLLVGRRHARTALLALAALMAVTGIAFSLVSSLWVLFIVAFVGTLNPSVGDVSAFRPLEQAGIADAVAASARTSAYARYSLLGTLGAALGTLAAGVPQKIGLPTAPLFLVYAALGALAACLYWWLPRPHPDQTAARVRLGPRSRRPVLMLAGLFCLDSFGGGFVLQSLIALWLLQRHGVAIADSAPILTAMQLLSAASVLAAPLVARRLGLVQTMVFTHLPSNVCLMLVPLMPWLEASIVLLLLRSAFNSMDVAPRSALVMALVEPHERAAAASITDVPRSLAAAAAPSIGGWLLAASPFGWFLVVGGAVKFGYDLLLLYFGRRLARERGVKQFD